MPKNKEACILSSDGGTNFYFMGNRGLYQAGVIPAGQRVRFGAVFTDATSQKGEFQEVTLVSHEAEKVDDFLYVFSSELACKTTEACSKLLRQGIGSNFTQFVSSDAEPVNIRMADRDGNPQNGKIVAKVTQNFVESNIVMSHNMVAPDGWVGLKLKFYLKTRGQNGQDLYGETFGTCR